MVYLDKALFARCAQGTRIAKVSWIHLETSQATLGSSAGSCLRENAECYPLDHQGGGGEYRVQRLVHRLGRTGEGGRVRKVGRGRRELGWFVKGGGKWVGG